MAETALQPGKGQALAERDERASTMTPRIDVLENDQELLLIADMPGVTADGVDIRFEKGELSVHGRRRAARSGQPWLWEYEAGNFFRSFRLSENVAADKIVAEMKDGVLTIHLPKVETAKPRRIMVKTA